MMSFVIPVYNEEDSLHPFFNVFIKEVAKLKENYEVIFVDDGSSDKSLEILQSFIVKNKSVRIFSFRKNRGKAEALTLGFQKAKGTTIVTLDADLQDKPTEIVKLLEKQKKDKVDVISGWRKYRKDKSKMVIISKIFNYITGRLFGVYLHDYNCGLKVYTSEAAKSLKLYGGQHRFIPLLVNQNGFTVDEVVVEHEKRKYGKSKYGFSKVWKDLPDVFTMLFLTKYSKRPLHFFGPVGGGLFSLGILILLYLTYIKFYYQVSIGDRPLLLFGVLLVVSGLQIFFSGFLAELIVSTSEKEYKAVSLKYSTD